MRNGLIYHFLDDDELLRISNKIKEAEKTTAGEICVSIKEHKSFTQKRKRDRLKRQPPMHCLRKSALPYAECRLLHGGRKGWR